MNICLKSKSKECDTQTVSLHLKDRLPERIHAPCDVIGRFHIEAFDHYYIMNLEVTGRLTIMCQRCLTPFEQDYHNTTQLAVCLNDEVVETLMEDFECIVVDEHELDLVEIVTDELYLFSPEKHENSTHCDSEMSQWIHVKDEILATTLGL